MNSGSSRIAVLLGAGASADAGIPTTVEMTDAVITRMRDPDYVRVLDFIRYTIAADLAQRHEGHRYQRVGVDVERLFASVELLIDRYDQPWSAFVATWHPGLEAFAPKATVRESDLSFELSAFGDALTQMSDPRRNIFGTTRLKSALARLIGRAIERTRPSDVSALLARVRDEMLHSLFDVLRIDDPTTVSYLSPLVDLARRQGSLTVASLNYDRSIENVAELEGMLCDTGIESWAKGGAIGLLPDIPLRLLKLHGSIDWIAEERISIGELPVQRVRKVENEAEKQRYRGPAVVFGETGKLRSEGPYLELLLTWAADLDQADNLLVVGYSFRDRHVNELIARWFNADSKRRIILVDPSEPSAEDHRAFGWHLKQVNQKPPHGARTIRFEHVAGTTRDTLAEGIARASAPVPVSTN